MPVAPVAIKPTAPAWMPLSRPGIVERNQICPPAGVSDATAPLLDPADLQAALGEAVGDWHRQAFAKGATAIYVRDQRRVRITISDMIRSCSGISGSTDTLLETEDIADPVAKRHRMMSATSAVLVRWPDIGRMWQSRLVMWVADRCKVVVETLDKGTPAADLPALGRVVHVAKLEPLCAQR